MSELRLRRCLLVGIVVVLVALPIGVCAQQQQQYRVAACDWMMLKRQKLGEFQLAKDINADGVEVDMGPLGKRVLFDNKLREPAFQQLFRRTADSLGVAVPSIAMSGFFAQSFLERENYKDLIVDCLNTMDVMGAHVAFLPLGGSGNDWKQPGEARQEMVRRLHEVGEMAFARDKVIAIRTQQDARADLVLLKEVNSKGNPLAHAVLRGRIGSDGHPHANYHYEHLELLSRIYTNNDFANPAVIVDCNHDNSAKRPLEQMRICNEVLDSMNRSKDIAKLVRGFMIESYLEDGAQPVGGGVYGKSITDPCLGWEKTSHLIMSLADRL